MAFVTRSLRQQQPVAGSSPSQVGPGSYDVKLQDRDYHTWVPFTFADERPCLRKSNQYQADLPGPGQYIRDVPAAKIARPRRRCPERSPPSRPAADREEEPGPGAYEVTPTRQPCAVRYAPDRAGPETQPRIKTAPSIPARGENYGPGMKCWRTVGSCLRDPPSADLLATQIAALDLTDMIQLSVSCDGGLHQSPGTYSLESRSIAGIARPLSPEASAHSRNGKAHLRWPHLPDANSAEGSAASLHLIPAEVASTDGNPGPGTYNVPDSMEALRPTHAHSAKYHFGGTAPRAAQELQPRPETAQNPGPGTYDVSRLTTGKTAKAARRSCPGTPKALCTFGCLERLHTPKAPTGLGPGQYNMEARSVAGEAQSTLRRFGMGGRGSSSRMASRPQTGDLGPGSYSPNLQDSHQVSVMGGAPFASRTPKPGVPEPAKPLPADVRWPGMPLYHLQHLNRKKDLPGPGEYDAALPGWQAGWHVRRQGGFLSNTRRFVKEPSRIGITPGPDKYKQLKPFGGYGAFDNRHSKSAFAGGTDARFNPLADLKAARLPGPGAYFIPQQHVKPSFNVTVE
ncbi:hypothetical protein WJX74_001853 [Apatococcus lobatus]|uniref:Uncharacterized protein n=1 Tax=Apatococcus lobatus TaxID=904363 RepID=A0AAW1RL19_9CHLO